MSFDKEFDASGMSCPLPVVKTKKALVDMESGQVLRVISTDCGSVKDIQAFTDQTGHALMSSTEEGGKYIFLIKRK
jgi:tRNA 2-thiouridine synthesizing protein A